MSHGRLYQGGAIKRVVRPIPRPPPARASPPPPVRRLHVLGPRQPFAAGVVVRALEALLHLDLQVLLDLAVTVDRVEAGAQCETFRLEEVRAGLQGAAVSWEIEVADELRLASRWFLVTTAKARPDWVPQRPASSFADQDPLSLPLEAGRVRRDGESLFVSYGLSPAPSGRVMRAQQELTRPALPHDLWEVFATVMGHGPREPRFDAPWQTFITERLAGLLCEVSLVVAIGGDEWESLTSRARGVMAAFKSTFVGLSLDGWRCVPGPFPPRLVARQPSLLLPVDEPAALWHPLSGQVVLPGVRFVSRPSVPPPPALVGRGGLQLGVNDYRGRVTPVRLSLGDFHSGHALLVGATGSGKTTAMHNLLWPRRWRHPNVPLSVWLTPMISVQTSPRVACRLPARRTRYSSSWAAIFL